MRILTILCSGIVAFSLLAAPASADPTSNTIFAVFDFGGFSSDGTNDNDYYEKESSTLLIINLATIEGSIEDFIALHFAEINISDYDLSQVSYFILGHITGSDHLVLSDTSGDPGPLPDGFEDPIIDGIQNMGDLGEGELESAGGMLFVTPGELEGQLGTSVNDILNNPSGDPVASVGEGVDLLGFTDPVFLAHIILTFNNGVLTGQVPEPGLALLAVMGVAGVVLVRRRRRCFAA